MSFDMTSCTLCPRGCGADRAGGKTGVCGAGEQVLIARAAAHYWEEPCISGENGSGAVFFSGCSLKCVFCQNYEISEVHRGVVITPYQLSEEYRKLEALGAQNIEFVTPSHHADAILESLTYYRPRVPLIWNSSGYDSINTLKRLEGVIDIYLPDFKYSDDALAAELSGAFDYVKTALSAIGEMLRQTGRPQFDENGIMKKGVIVRHLILPAHTRNSVEALRLLKSSFGDDILVSLMCQYVPWGKAVNDPKLGRKITRREYDKVKDELFALGLDGFTQELSAAKTEYIPDWDIFER